MKSGTSPLLIRCVWGLRFGVWCFGLGLGVWGLGFGVWCLVFWVALWVLGLGSGLGVQGVRLMV